MRLAARNSIIIALIIAVAYFAAMVAVAAASPTANEKVLLNLVNSQREAEGIAPLKWGSRLSLAARSHSREMIDSKYFSHVSPAGETLADRLKNSGIRAWASAGENLAGAPTPQIAFDLWLKSPGHKANLLKRKYTRIGIGIIEGGPYGMMMTMDMAEKPVSATVLKLSKDKVNHRSGRR